MQKKQRKNYPFNYFLYFLIIIIFFVSNSNFTKERRIIYKHIWTYSVYIYIYFYMKHFLLSNRLILQSVAQVTAIFNYVMIKNKSIFIYFSIIK